MKYFDLPVVFSFGMGWDSMAVLLRWLFEPESRDFDLKNLIIVTAQTGDEYPALATLMEQFLFPILREFNIRVVQVARAGQYDPDGIVVLEDTRQPYNCWIQGAWTLTQHSLRAGIVPLKAKGKRTCSAKFKGWVIDRWVQQEFGELPRRRVVAFNANEPGRLRDRSIGGVNIKRDLDRGYRYILAFNDDEDGRLGEYLESGVCLFELPLMYWQWGREKVMDYVRQTLEWYWGIPIEWRKSHCYQCPFTCSNGSVKRMIEDYFANPDLAGRAAVLEYVANCINPRMFLYGDRYTQSLHYKLEKAGNTEALFDKEQRLASIENWAIYRVRRIWKPPNKTTKKGLPAKRKPDRHTEIVFRGTRDECREWMETEAWNREMSITWNEGLAPRLYFIHAPEDTRYITSNQPEEYYVPCPDFVEEKSLSTFEKNWAAMFEEQGNLLEWREEAIAELSVVE